VTPGYLTCEISQRARWIPFYLGLGVDAAAVLLVLALNPHLCTRVSLEPATLSSYVTLVAPTPRPAVTPLPTTAPRSPKIAKLQDPHLAQRVTAPKQVEVAKAPPMPDVVVKVAPAKSVAAAPIEQVKTNAFDSEKSEEAVVQEPARKVQTGGFGDPNGFAAQGDPERQSLTATNVGSFDLPAGPGRGNGTGDVRGVSGRVRASGFSAASAQPTLQARNENVAASGFGTVVTATSGTDAQRVPAKSQIQPVQILFKPRPAYTSEALNKGVQGEVLLDVVFEASGALRVNRVVTGLGYGLDDTALEAAKKIQFRPALRDGQPYDYAALVLIRFELAD
jgi:TonB family protein